jgi:hypothetical protein
MWRIERDAPGFHIRGPLLVVLSHGVAIRTSSRVCAMEEGKTW